MNRCARAITVGNHVAARAALRTSATDTNQTASATARTTTTANRLCKDAKRVVELGRQTAIGVHRYRSTITRAAAARTHADQTSRA